MTSELARLIPILADLAAPTPIYVRFVEELARSGFEGDISASPADRSVFATDNSIYQIYPDAIVYPAVTEDFVRIAKLAREDRFQDIAIRPRGGGTGTNGQSLGTGVIVDASRHMNGILEINLEEGWARVEAGVVKDQLENELEPHGFFFPPELSTSNRATIGGMISTDACGQGSCRYGKTRDYVLELTVVMLDGTVWTTTPLDETALEQVKARADHVGEAHRVVDGMRGAVVDEFIARLPQLNRCLTGYDLAHLTTADGRFNLNSVLCGSEGTLAFIAEAKLRIIPQPKCSSLLNVFYEDFTSALRDAQNLVALGAASVETIDSKVLGLAKDDAIWVKVADYFPADSGAVQGVNFIEFVGDDEAEIARQMQSAIDLVSTPGGLQARSGHIVVHGRGVERIWEMRKRSVGLLGNVPDDRRPIPFIEDTVVPPASLADYVTELRALLDGHGLSYGMFGHVDAGVLHVRPCMNLRDPADETLIREITEGVVGLVAKYGGLLWGEHGKGVRSEFAPKFFGPLYSSIIEIKRAFDPLDQMNPGKIASSRGRELLKIDEVPLRGQFDRQIGPELRNTFKETVNCNGNGACYDWNPNDPMCPSWRATRDRRHSPKGRAELLRHWLRLLAGANADVAAAAREASDRTIVLEFLHSIRRSLARKPADDYSHVVKEAMDGCLGCKSCSGHCPIKIDIPTARSRFLELYHTRYARPAQHFFLASLEPMLPWLARYRRASNAFLSSRLAKLTFRQLGLVNLPLLSPFDPVKEAARIGCETASAERLALLTANERARCVVVVQDPFTSNYNADVVLDMVRLIQALGFRAYLAPYRPSGKPLSVIGMMGAFRRVAGRNAEMLSGLAATGVPLVGVDPSITLMYRSEYKSFASHQPVPTVLLPQEWLAGALNGEATPRLRPGKPLTLLQHCTEHTNAPDSGKLWKDVFKRFGVDLEIASVGCCGMAGTYGHETSHLGLSEKIYRSSWARHFNDGAGSGCVATGYSCRSQVKRFSHHKIRHPVQALLGALMDTVDIKEIEEILNNRQSKRAA